MAELFEALSTAGWPSRLLTLADWDDLPEDDGYKLELGEGVVHVVPRPSLRHQHAVPALWAALQPQLADGHVVVIDCDVLVQPTPPTVRAPDLVVLTAAAYERGVSTVDPADVVLAVEVVSPGSARTDRVTKASEYAEAGIPDYWVVDLDGAVTLSAMRLAGSAYLPSGEHAGRVELEVAGATVSIDLDDLVR